MMFSVFFLYAVFANAIDIIVFFIVIIVIIVSLLHLRVVLHITVFDINNDFSNEKTQSNRFEN